MASRTRKSPVKNVGSTSSYDVTIYLRFNVFSLSDCYPKTVLSRDAGKEV